MNRRVPPPTPPGTSRSPPGNFFTGAGSPPWNGEQNGAMDMMDDSLMMRNIWLKLGLLDTINYKMDETLKKLGTIENRMDRLETTVRTVMSSGGASGGGHETRHETNNNLPDMVRVMPSTGMIMPMPSPPTRTPVAKAPVAKAPVQLPVNRIHPAPTIIFDHVLPASCYVDSFNKDECERKLRARQHNGMYLIRKSEKEPKGRVLMVWFHNDGICKHYKIFGNHTTSFQLDELPNFSSMVDLIKHYSQNKLPQSMVVLSIPFPG